MGVVTDEDLEYQAAHIAEALDGKRVGQGWQCFCPVHEKDGASQHETRSLGIDLKDGTILFNCRSLGCHRDNGVINALIEMGLWKKRGDASWDDYRETASYPYLDEFGQFVSTKKRLELEVWSEQGQKLVKDKKFSFSPSVKGNDRLTFFRAELLGMWPNRSVILLEGEKCVLAVEKHTGLLAVTLPTGANREWTEHQTTLMTGRKVILIPDRDDPGAAWIRNAIAALWGVAESIRIVTLPGMDDPKDDTYDWFEQYGHSKDEFIQVVKTTNPLTERDRDLIVSPNNVSSEPAPEVSDVPESAPIVEMGSTAEEAERSVLAHLLLAPDKVESVTSELFTLPAHRLIIKAMLDLYEGQSRWDTLTIADHLESKNELEKIGGRLFLDKLRPGDFESHLAILERNAKARKIKDLSKNLAVIADGPESAEEKQRATEEAFLSSTERSERHPVQKLDVFITQALQEIDEAHARGGEPLGFKTGYPTLDKLLGGIDRGLLAILGAPTSMGKCLPGWVLIDDPDTGERIPLERFYQEKRPIVLGLDGNGNLRATRVSDWIDSGVQPCYRIQTASGRVVDVTAHHPFLTVRGWEPLHDLRPGEKIATPARLPIEGREMVKESEARLLGCFIADGGLTDSCPEFTNIDPDIISSFKRDISSRFPECSVRQDKITYIVKRSNWRSGDSNWMRGGRNPVTEWLRSMGVWGNKSDAKRLPDCVWRWSKESLRELMRAIMSCDGSIYAQGLDKTQIIVEFSVASQGLAEDMQHALLRFGVASRLSRNKNRCWRVLVSSPEDVERYQRDIGWIGEKNNRFLGHSFGKRSNRSVSKDVWSRIKMCAQQQDMSVAELNRQAVLSGVACGDWSGRAVSQRRLGAYAEILGSADLAFLANRDILWDEIVSIEHIGDHRTYDLTVPDGANFVAQDVCVHNTALALNFASNMALAGNKVLFFEMEMRGSELAKRLLTIRAARHGMGLRSDQIKTGQLLDGEGNPSDELWDQLMAVAAENAMYPMWIDESSSQTTASIWSRSERLKREVGLDVIFIDYLGIMTMPKAENMTRSTGMISGELRRMARDLDVAIIAMSQLNRDAMKRGESRLYDIKDANKPAEDAHYALLLQKDQDPKTARPDVIDVKVEKNRNGPTGQVPLFYKANSFAFFEIGHE